MDSTVKEAILRAKKIIDTRLTKKTIILPKNGFNGYERSYFTTNELISEYLDLIHINHTMNALSVTASGDQAFNLVTKGISEIDTFDINRLTEYVALGLKKAMILKYNYNDYIKNLKILIKNYSSLDDVSSIITDLLPFMDEKYKIFWNEILNYNYKLQKKDYASYGISLNLIQILCKDFTSFDNVLSNNNYLRDEESYNKLKNNIGKTNITFNWVDAENIAEHFKNKEYDIILLSNILDYFYHKWGYLWDYKKLENYEKDLRRIIKENGIIFLFYIFDYELLYPNKTYKINEFPIIRGSDVKIKDLTNEKIEALHNTNFYDDNSGIILVRK